MSFIKTRIVPAFTAACLAVVGAFTAFASGGSASPVITTDMLSTVIDGINANVAAVLPVGLSVFALMVGVGIIPVIIYKFIHR